MDHDPDDTSPEASEADIIPFRIIQGEGKTVVPEVFQVAVESFALDPEQAQHCIQLNEQSRELLIKVGELDAQILRISHEKIGFIKEYEGVQVALRAEAEDAAKRVGIDPDDKSKSWTLHVAAGRFVRTR